MSVEDFNKLSKEMKEQIRQNKAQLKETLKTLDQYRRGQKDRYCVTSVRDFACHHCCLFCRKICLEPKCWEVFTLKNCAWRATAEEILAKKLDRSFKTKKENEREEKFDYS